MNGGSLGWKTIQHAEPAIQIFPYGNLVSMQASPRVGMIRILPGLWQSPIVARVPMPWENVWKKPSKINIGISHGKYLKCEDKNTFEMLELDTPIL